MKDCDNDHRYQKRFATLPNDQGGLGRHKCCGCAYDRGFQDGKKREEKLDIGLDSLLESQAGTVRHKSPHAAYALGYFDGVSTSYVK
jgi:hypothetical protein